LQDEHLVLDVLLLLDEHGAADGHDEGDDAIDALGGLVLGGLEVAGGVLGDGDWATKSSVKRSIWRSTETRSSSW
jgi:hypothetical protein